MTLHSADDGSGAAITAIVVTYNSAQTLPRLVDSLRRSTVALRVIIVDNGSSDSTLEIARRIPELVVVATGSNLGYSGGINVGRRHVSPGSSLAILNPDLVIAKDALEVMRKALDDEPDVGIVAPLLRSEDGTRFDSLRREPSILAAFGDAVFGSHWPDRPTKLTETMRRSVEYRAAHDVAWAGGAALLVSPACNEAVGEWDSSTYFLYSEETDYARRARDLGFRVRFERRAVAWHVGSGSGQPAQLVALLSVNRIKYFERLHGQIATIMFRLAVIMHHALRPADVRHRVALRYLLNRRSWVRLPGTAVVNTTATGPLREVIISEHQK